jgi:glutaredoxin
VTVLTLYGRPGCTLCDAARRELDEIQATRAELSIREVNIDEDPELHRRFLERVPVVELDGEIVSELRLDANAVRARLDTVVQ